MRFLLLRIFLPLVLFWLVRSVLRGIFSSFGSAVNTSARADIPTVSPGGDLKKDPVCGTYVSTKASLTRSVGGEVVHFCSKECRDKYKVA